jgi:hypothetical protein
MSIKFIVAFTILAVVVALAGTVPGQLAAGHVELTVAATVHGTALQPGVYKVVVAPGSVTFTKGRDSQTVPAKVETRDRKFDNSQVQYEVQGNQNTIREIGVGGTKVRLVFN